jgi:hypothetical protein
MGPGYFFFLFFFFLFASVPAASRVPLPAWPWRGSLSSSFFENDYLEQLQQ